MTPSTPSLAWYYFGDTACVAGVGERGPSETFTRRLAALPPTDIPGLVAPPEPSPEEPRIIRIMRLLVAARPGQCYPWDKPWPPQLRVAFRRMPPDRPREFILGPTRFILPVAPLLEVIGDRGPLAEALAGAPEVSDGEGAPHDFDPRTDCYANEVLGAADWLVREEPDRLRKDPTRARDVLLEALNDRAPEYARELPPAFDVDARERLPSDDTFLTFGPGRLRLTLGLAPQRCPPGGTRELLFRTWPCGAWAE